MQRKGDRSVPLLLGIDTGGTFTDAVLFDEDTGVVASAKALTTRHDLAIGIGGALDGVLSQAGAAPQDIALVSLSTTLATNAVVEGQGGRICLVLIGFDETALDRADLAQALKGDPVVLATGGHDAHGEPLASLDTDDLERHLKRLEGQVSGFAVAGQFGVRNPEHEVAVRDLIIAGTGLPVTCSHELSSRLDGPRRALTCVLNARLITLIHHLISAASELLETRGIAAPLMVVRGDGALISAEVAAIKPIETILSGPAASLVGAAHLTRATDAIVSDIGGTTTDHAILSGGRPKLDPAGATVGGWRTMVEAVAMQTIGLGGDSEVHVVRDGLRTGLELGPRRMVPLSLMATDHTALVMDTLRRQMDQSRPQDHDGRFAMAIDRGDVHPSTLTNKERQLLECLRDAPLALDRLLETRVQLTILNRLVGRGIVLLASVTPSDAAHVLDLQSSWNGDAARLGLTLMARQRDAMGHEISSSADAMAHWIIDTLVDRSAHALLASALEQDGLGGRPLARSLLDARTPNDRARLVDVSASLNVPLVGLGASAPTYYPRVAEALGTTALIPEHAGVANAVGAVVGQIRVVAEASIVQPEQGRFRVYSHLAPATFSGFDEAVAFAENALSEEAGQRARQAGAGEFKIRVTRSDKTAEIEGKPTIVESVVRAVATGRPRIAE